MTFEPGSQERLGAVFAAFHKRRRPRRNVRILRTPTGFVEVRFWSRRRAWLSIYDEGGWPSQRLTRWATRDEPSLARALRRVGFEAAEADLLAKDISEEWGEPVGDVADVVIPAATVFALSAIGTVALGRWVFNRLAGTA